VARSRTLLIFLAALAGAALLTVAGIKTFGAWDQVTELWESGVSPLLLAVMGHPHFFRFLTAYPGFLLEDSVAGWGFSFYICIFFACNVALLRHNLRLATGAAPTLATWLVFFAVHMFMNGRGVIAWTAWLLCIMLCVRMSRGDSGGLGALLQGALACWLAAVSTGVFIVVAVALALFYLQFRRRSRGGIVRKLAIAACAAPFIFYIVEHLYVAIMKNIDFFGGGIDGVIHMLSHGLGRVLFGSDILAVFLIGGGAIAVLLLVVLLRMRKHRFTPLEQLLVLPLCGGMFGLTVLTLALPVFLMYQQTRRNAAAGPAPGLAVAIR
jgi:hypothetical protein